MPAAFAISVCVVPLLPLCMIMSPLEPSESGWLEKRFLAYFSLAARTFYSLLSARFSFHPLNFFPIADVGHWLATTLRHIQIPATITKITRIIITARIPPERPPSPLETSSLVTSLSSFSPVPSITWPSVGSTSEPSGLTPMVSKKSSMFSSSSPSVISVGSTSSPPSSLTSSLVLMPSIFPSITSWPF